MAVPPSVHAEHRVVRALRHAGATAPDAAQPFSPTRAMDGRALERLLAVDLVRDAGNGRCWLDEAAYGAYRGERRKRVLVALAVLLAIGIVLGYTGALR